MCNMRNAAVTALSHSTGFINLKYITEHVFGPKKSFSRTRDKMEALGCSGCLRLVVIKADVQTRDGRRFVVAHQCVAPDVT